MEELVPESVSIESFIAVLPTIFAGMLAALSPQLTGYLAGSILPISPPLAPGPTNREV